MHRKDDDANGVDLIRDTSCDLEARETRHCNVHQCDVRMVLSDQFQSFPAIPGFRNDLNVADALSYFRLTSAWREPL